MLGNVRNWQNSSDFSWPSHSQTINDGSDVQKKERSGFLNVLLERLRNRIVLLDRVARSFSERHSKHVHHWVADEPNVVAEIQKGERGKGLVAGAFEQCSGCPEGRLIPFRSDFSIVGCTKALK